MTEKPSYQERQKEAKRLYEQRAKRKCVVKISTSKADDINEWEAITIWLRKIGNGDVKHGIYYLAKENGIVPLTG